MAFRKTLLLNREIPFRVIESEGVFVLVFIKPYFRYENNKPTKDILGYKYMVVNIESFEKYEFKVEGNKPLISADLLLDKRERGEKIYVEFDNPTIKVYWNSAMNCYMDSLKADGIQIFKSEE